VNELGEFAEPSGAATVTVPVVADGGTLTINRVGVAKVTVAGPPLNDTAFWLATSLNPLPKTETVVPTLPRAGSTVVMTTGSVKVAESTRPIARRLPTASYVYDAALPV
jgi:hypothetical protein